MCVSLRACGILSPVTFEQVVQIGGGEVGCLVFDCDGKRGWCPNGGLNFYCASGGGVGGRIVDEVGQNCVQQDLIAFDGSRGKVE